MSKQEVILCHDLTTSLKDAIERCSHDNLYIITDTHTHQLCLPHLKETNLINHAIEISIGAEDINKNIETLSRVWESLCEQGATRHSLLINLGGGMVTDLGGFAAATFKRGINYINIPTTLLAMVDASVGGKTGINFHGLKNEVGVFAPAQSVLLDTFFLKSLDYENFISGYAEMLKHGLISTNTHWVELLQFDTHDIDYDLLRKLVGHSVQVKEDIVEPENAEVFISHGGCLEEALEVRKMILEECSVKEIKVNYIGAAVGSHAGPGTIAIFFKGNTREHK